MKRPPSTIRRVSDEDVLQYADQVGIELTTEETEVFARLINDKVGALRALESLGNRSDSLTYSTRDMGYRPGPEEDPLNAFIRRCEVRGATDGPLAGWTVGVKDNIPVAGIEMTIGSRAFEGFIPPFDAEVITRLLDAGASIVGKTNLDELAISGSGEMTAYGPVRNPRDEAYLAGGSSGGSAVAVVTESVDVALGTDQAGSIRIPAAWCGCVGHKPTFGLVPYSGCLPGGPTYDHVGPMARTVEQCAKALSVLAGPDGVDARQPSEVPQSDGFESVLAEGVDDLTIGILDEGFGLEHSDPAVDETVRTSIERFGDLGTSVVEHSIPMHQDGILVWLGVGWEENAALLRDNGQGYYRPGPYHQAYIEAFAKAKAAMSPAFSPTVKLKLVFGEYLRQVHHGSYHAIAQNLRPTLRAAYDDAFETVDLLAMPTCPQTAFKVEENLSTTELIRRAQGKDGRANNTMPFDMTGHPAISVPCGTTNEGLPIGLMLVGRRFDDATVLRAAHAFEQELAPAI